MLDFVDSRGKDVEDLPSLGANTEEVIDSAVL